MGERVHVFEVGPRDGLQAEAGFVPTERKVELVTALLTTGIRRVQVTSFVRADRIPQLADAEAVMAAVERPAGVQLDVLLPNRRGLERAVAAGADSITLFLSASASHNRRNLQCEPEDMLAEFALLVPEAKAAGLLVHCAVSTAFGCPYEGVIADEPVVELAGRLFELGIEEVVLGDTTGMGNPTQVERLSSRLLAAYPDLALNLHFHDTRGMALANVVAGLRAGVRRFDGSVGGLGGCPYADGATGNVATEDLVHMLEEMGLDTGIDLDALIGCARLAQELVGRKLSGHVLEAGKASELVTP